MDHRITSFISTFGLFISLFISCAPYRPVSTTMMEQEERVEWLLMTSQEQNQFKAQKTREERDRFIEEFWQKRNPSPGSARNDLREEIAERVDFCNTWFRESPGLRPGWDSDRGRIYIVLGPPDSRERQDAPYGSGRGYYQNRSYERWTYGQHALTLYFVSSQSFGGFRLEMPPLALHRILENTKMEMLNGLSSGTPSLLTVKLLRLADQISIQLQTSEIYFEEQSDVYIARFKLLLSPEETGIGEPVSLVKTVKMSSENLLKATELTLSIESRELPRHLAKSPLILEIEDDMSHKKAVIHIGQPKTTEE